MVLLELGLGNRQIGFALIYDSLVRRRIDFGANLAHLYLAIVITKELLNDPRHIAPDDDRELGVDSAGRGNSAGDCSARNWRCHVFDRIGCLEAPPHRAAGSSCNEEQQTDN